MGIEKEFSYVRQSPAEKEVKAGMFSEGVKMPKIILSEHSEEWWGRHEGGPQNPRRRPEQRKHVPYQEQSWSSTPYS